MKKLIALFVTILTINSCSNDDSVNNATILEGNWLLTTIGGGDRPEDFPNTEDVTNQNIKYMFHNNKYNVTRNGEISEKGTFEVEENSFGTLQLHLTQDSSEPLIIYTIIEFSEDNNTVIFQDDGDWILTLKRIQ